MTNQSTKDRVIPDKSPKTDLTIPYLPSESIFKSKHEKTVQMETDFSPPLKLETLIATFWVPETTKRPRCITVSEKGSLMYPSVSGHKALNNRVCDLPYSISVKSYRTFTKWDLKKYGVIVPQKN